MVGKHLRHQHHPDWGIDRPADQDTVTLFQLETDSEVSVVLVVWESHCRQTGMDSAVTGSFPPPDRTGTAVFEDSRLLLVLLIDQVVDYLDTGLQKDSGIDCPPRKDSPVSFVAAAVHTAGSRSVSGHTLAAVRS